MVIARDKIYLELLAYDLIGVFDFHLHHQN